MERVSYYPEGDDVKAILIPKLVIVWCLPTAYIFLRGLLFPAELGYKNICSRLNSEGKSLYRYFPWTLERWLSIRHTNVGFTKCLLKSDFMNTFLLFRLQKCFSTKIFLVLFPYSWTLLIIYLSKKAFYDLFTCIIFRVTKTRNFS